MCSYYDDPTTYHPYDEQSGELVYCGKLGCKECAHLRPCNTPGCHRLAHRASDPSVLFAHCTECTNALMCGRFGGVTATLQGLTG